jgi:hypothetical protein
MDDAGAALRGIAADMRAGKAEIFPQEVNQKRSVLVPAPLLITAWTVEKTVAPEHSPGLFLS